MTHITYKDEYYTGAVNEYGQLIKTTEVCYSKVYRTYHAHTPSGLKQYARVWNKRLNKAIDVRIDLALVDVID